MTGLARSWPLGGRQAQVALLTAMALDRSADAAVLTGDAGVGKTRLADEVAERLTAQHMIVHRVVAGSSTHQAPFAGVLHLVSSDIVATLHQPTGALRLASALRDSLAAVDGRRCVVLVDDAHHLDEPTCAVLSQVLVSTGTFALVTVRDGAPMPESLHPVVHRDRCTWTRLTPLRRDECRVVVEEALGAPLDAETEQALWQASAGNPLYLRETVLAAHESDRLRLNGGLWELTGPLVVTDRLREVVASRLNRLSDAHRDLARRIALCEPLRVDVLDAHRSMVLEELLEAGHVSVDTRGDAGGVLLARLSHPVMAEVLRDELAPDDRRRLLSDHIAQLGDTTKLSPDEQVQAAVWSLEAGLPADAFVLLRAAQTARNARQPELMGTLAGAAVSAGGGWRALLLHSVALHEVGDHQRALDLMRQPFADERDELAVVRLVVHMQRVMQWGLDDADGAFAVLAEALDRVHEPLLQRLLLACQMSVLTFSDRPDDALAMLPSATSPEIAIRSLAGVATAVALTSTGRTAEALREIDALRQAELAEPGHNQALQPSLHLGMRSRANAEEGNLDRAIEDAASTFVDVVNNGESLGETWAALSAARAHGYAGRLATALRWTRQGALAAERGSLPMGRRAALTLGAYCAAQLGEDPERHLAAIIGLDLRRGFLRHELPVGLAWSLTVNGRADEGRDVIRHTLSGIDADAGPLTSHVFAVHEAARLGLADEVRDRVERLRGLVRSPLHAARLDDALARAGGSADECRAAADELRRLGAHLFAAEAYAVAADRAAAAGDRAMAGRCDADGSRCLTLCEGAATAAVGRLRSTATLTAREREIALLVSRGLTSRQIAERLVVSMRTVDNHVQHILGKLGAPSRAEIGRLLGHDHPA